MHHKRITYCNSLFFLFFLTFSVAWGQTFNEITDLNDLTDGEYLIIGDGSTNDGMMLNTTSSGPIINYTSVTNPGSSISSGFTSENIFEISVVSSSPNKIITIYNSSVGYVSWGNTGTGSGNHAGFSNGTPSTKEEWQTTVSSGLWTLANVATPGRILQWNNSSPRFACYTSAQVKLRLFKKEIVGGNTVTFKANGGSGSDYTQTSSTPANLTPNTFTRTGYSFDEWNTTANGTGTSYADEASYDFSADMDLYAQWNINSYSVTYNGNGNTGGTAPNDSNSPYNYNASVTVLGNTGSLTKTGNTFSGWNTKADGTGTTYQPSNTFSMPANNVVLYAKWTPDNYAVIFDKNDAAATGSMSNQTYPYGSTANLNANAYSLTGYAFKEWNTAANGTGTVYANQASFTMSVTNNVTLYAQWEVYTGPCHTETFSNIGNSGSYGTKTWTGEGGTWTATDAREDQAINGKAITFRNGEVTSPTFTDGISSLTVTTKYPFSDGTGTIDLYVNNNKVGSFNVSTTVQTQTINNIDVSGNIIIEFRNPINNKRPAIDDVNWTCYSAAPQPPVITSPLTYSSEYNSPASYTITADYLPTSFNATNLPTGLNVNTTTGVISGTVTDVPGNYNVSISATNAEGSDTQTLVWTVTPKNLTISGLSGSNKAYDGNTTASLSGTPSLVGVKSGDTVNLSGTPTANFDNKNVGTAKPITVSGYTLTGADAGKYTLSQPTGLTANITAKPLTVSGATAQNKVWDGTTAATITGATLSGVIAPDVVTVSGGGTFAQSNAGTDIAVTANLTLGGTDGGNYSITQPTGLKANITKANPVFTTSPISISVGGTYTLPGANISSNSNGTLSYSITGGGHATYTAPSTLSGVTVGTETLTVNQAAGTNHNAGSTTVTVTVSSFIYQNGDVRPAYVYSDFSYNNAWEEFNGSTWNPRTSSPQGSTPSGRIIIDKKGIGGGGNSKNTYNDIIIINGGELQLNDFATNHNNNNLIDFLYPDKGITVEGGGKLILNGDIKLIATNTLKVENDGEFIINNAYMTNNHPIWNGVENFMTGSTVTIQDWNWTPSATTSTLFQNSTAISSNSAGYKFGNLLIDAEPTDDWTLVGSSSLPNLKLCENNLEIYNPGAKFISGTSNNTSSFIIGGDMIIYDGWFNFGTTFTGNTTFTNHFTINGDFIDISDDQLKLHYRVEGNGTADGTITIFGDFIIGEDVTQLTNQFDKKFILKGGTEAAPKIIEVGPTDVLYVPIEIESGYRVLKKDLYQGTNSSVVVKSGATLDFGFAPDNLTPLNIIRNGTQIGQKFTLENGGIIKITSPDGITSGGNYTGNIQIGANNTNRTFDAGGIYHYIGKANQVSGNGLPTGITGKVIVELDTNSLTYHLSQSKTIDSDGELDIRKGWVVDNSTGGFSGDGKLTMNTDNGARYQLFQTGTEPGLNGLYNLTKGVVEFAGSGATRQNVNGGDNHVYQEIEVTGSNVGNSNTNILLHDNGGFSVLENAVFEINQRSIKCETTNGCAVMVDNGAVFKTGNSKGFNGFAPSGIGNDDSAIHANIQDIDIILGATSIVEYISNGTQMVSDFTPGYENLKISGSAPVIQGSTSILVNNIASVTPTGKLTVQSTADAATPNVLVASKGIQVAAGGQAIFENNAQLMQDTDAVNNGGIDVKRAFTFSTNRKEYNFLSAPVKDENRYFKTSIYSPNPPSVQAYNEATYYFDEVNGKYIQAKGYAVKEPSSGTPEGLFTGVASNGNISYTLQKSATGGGYNLVGNPYPSNLDIKDLHTSNSSKIEPEFYFWDNRGNTIYIQQGSSYQGNQYAIYNAIDNTGVAATGASGYPLREPTRYVKIGTGFMVQAQSDANGKSLDFKNEFRVAGHNEIGYFGKPSNFDEVKDRYWLTITSPSGMTVMNAVVYFDGGKDDFWIDDTESFGPSDDLFTIVEDKQLSIQGKSPFSDFDKVPLGYRAFEEGYYFIQIHNQEGVFADGQSIYILDRQLNKLHNLSNNGPYKFLTRNGEFTNRFVILYRPTHFWTNSETISNQIDLVKKDNQIVISSSIDKIIEVEVFDLNSRSVYKKTGVNSNNHSFSALSFNNQIIVVTVKTDKGEFITKKFVNN